MPAGTGRHCRPAVPGATPTAPLTPVVGAPRGGWGGALYLRSMATSGEGDNSQTPAPTTSEPLVPVPGDPAALRRQILDAVTESDWRAAAAGFGDPDLADV